jgi:ZIP family zinc transporter
MPAIGNISGGLVAERFEISGDTLSLALHVAAGIILAVVGIELLPTTLEADPPWFVLVVFLAGGFFSIGLDSLTDFIAARTGGGRTESGAWGIFAGVAVSTISLGLGLLLALGQVPADIPEGFATIATFKSKGVPRRTRLLLSLSFALPIFLGVTVGYWLVRGQPAIVKFGLLAFTAGILLTVAVEEIIPEAHKEGEARLAAVALVGGFALFTFISIYLG